MIENKIKEESKETKEVIKDEKNEKGNIKNQKKYKSNNFLHVFLIMLLMVLLFISMRFFENGHKMYLPENHKYILLTLITWICEYLILKGITNKSKLSLSILVATEVIYDIINYFVRGVRGSAITISDLVAVRTALSVSGNVSLNVDIDFIIGILFAAILITTFILVSNKIIEKKGNISIRLLKIIIGVLIVFILSRTSFYNKYSLWDINEAYGVLGTPITILRMVHDFNIKPPEGYNKKEVKKILEEYESDGTNNKEKENKNEIKSEEKIEKTAEITTVEDKPNIIVIVNESFSDYYNVYNDGYSDPIEYFTKLSKDKNVVSGVMYTSTFGGQTANVEYEFLTQNSMKILPIGTYVFQQYIKGPVKDSLIQNLKSQGYSTHSIHPWESYAYSRNKVYRLFGFDSIKFKDDIEGLEKNFNNDFFSDKSTYKELIKELDEKDENEKLFEYVLTVQNHTGYLNTDPEQITYNDEFAKNVYMQLIHKSAEALEEVIDNLKQRDEKYILLFFGDHQANLDDSDNFEEKVTEQYQVPFLIWANYDIEEEYNIETSTVFLQNYLLKAANLKFSTMNNYMEELKKYYPVITKRFYIDSDGNEFKNEDDKSENVKKIKEYEKINYYRIFDEK